MKKSILCSKVSDFVQCPVCKSGCTVKNGSTRTGKQQYRCKNCGKYFIENYSYHAYGKDLNKMIVVLTKEGVGIRSTARILKISSTTLLSRIIFIAKNIKQPAIPIGKTYEVDEMRSIRTHIKRLSRRTICFTRNVLLLFSILKIYFWM